MEGSGERVVWDVGKVRAMAQELKAGDRAGEGVGLHDWLMEVLRDSEG